MQTRGSGRFLFSRFVKFRKIKEIILTNSFPRAPATGHGPGSPTSSTCRSSCPCSRRRRTSRPPTSSTSPPPRQSTMWRRPNLPSIKKPWCRTFLNGPRRYMRGLTHISTIRRAAGGEKGGLRRAAQGPRRGAGAADRQGQCGPRFAGHRARHRAGKRAQPAVS